MLSRAWPAFARNCVFTKIKPKFYKGILAEHIVGQELIAIETNTRKKQCFWVRGKSQSQAEIDFLVQYKGYVIPVEVKSGKAGRLRSLHQFMDRCPHLYAVRMYAGPLEIQRVNSPSGKSFYLLNLPYFLASSVHKYLRWMIENMGSTSPTPTHPSL